MQQVVGLGYIFLPGEAVSFHVLVSGLVSLSCSVCLKARCVTNTTVGQLSVNIDSS